jgi:hypothetical protein
MTQTDPPKMNLLKQRYLYFSVYCGTLHNSQTMESARCPSTDEWIKCGMHAQWNSTQPLQ